MVVDEDDDNEDEDHGDDEDDDKVKEVRLDWPDDWWTMVDGGWCGY